MDTEEIEVQEPEPEEDQVQEQEPEAEPEPEQEEDVITIGDEEEEPEDKAPEWVRDLRKKHRHMKQRNRELEQKLAQYEQTQQQTADPGLKPTLEGCDYDSDQYEQKLSNWYEAKRRHEETTAKLKEEQQRQLQAYQEKVDEYQERKKSLKVRDYDEAESIVEDTLSVPQQNIIIEGAENPALLVYALGKNPKRIKELAKIKNYVRFAFEVAKLEKQLKVNRRKPRTEPEKTIKSTGTLSGTTDRTLDRLREEAAKTGDMSKVHAYRRKKRKAAAG